jgi:FtsK/SpoIIIE family
LTTPTTEDRMRIPIGMAAGDDIVWWEPAMNPHMLLVGPTGSGKTIFINSMIDLAAARGWLIDLLDPKELSYRGYIPESLKAKGLPVWPGINRVATSDGRPRRCPSPRCPDGWPLRCTSRVPACRSSQSSCCAARPADGLARSATSARQADPAEPRRNASIAS